ncbi:RNA-binding transcriptional accessory protein [Candidatus Gracilibacteria bacterium]|nr:MAG: RNA-binding transcriptional accessory protein [Candidatus Gracilibacteria bacterium]
MLEPNYTKLISSELQIKEDQVESVLKLVSEGATVPFIARYRKELTGGLDENYIRNILSVKQREEKLFKAKQTALNGIEEQGKLTEELSLQIEGAKTIKLVEEIYKPYKLKKKTKAMIAIEKGFQVIADIIKSNIKPETREEFKKLLIDYNPEEIIEGAIQIISSEIVASLELRDILTAYLSSKAILVSKIKGDKMIEKLDFNGKNNLRKFELYKDFEIGIKKIKSYQILAINRGEKLGILNLKLLEDEESFYLVKNYINSGETIDFLTQGIRLGYKTLFKSVQTEVLNNLTKNAEDEAIITFQKNLGNLLLTKPEYGKRVLAIDPGFRTGCKIALLDDLGNPLKFDKIFIHNEDEAIKKISVLVKEYKMDVVVIGNGTASNETVEIVKKSTNIPTYVVNESGASVYSASNIAAEEFPKLDVTDRGTISIGRRFLDPLSELVKIEPESIGVGMYQHDMSKSVLKEKLGYTVEDVVNMVGVNLNTASIYVLNYISGINKTIAKKICKNKPYSSRKDLKKVLSSKVFEQSAGFLRIPGAKQKYDNTDIHPEQYALAEYIENSNLDNITLYETKLDELKKLYPDVNMTTIDFIIDSLNNIGKEVRVNGVSEVTGKLEMEDLSEGQVLNGVVRNVLQFGVFVDIGVKNDGLVHVSQIADKYISNPMDEVEVGEKVKVKITKIDLDTGKIQLSMKGL